MAVPDRRPSRLYSGGSQIAVGEDKSAHVRVPGTQGPRWGVSSHHSQNVLLSLDLSFYI